MENRIFEFGGEADVLIKFKNERIVDGVKYAANEPYTFLQDAQIQLSYQNNTSNSNSGAGARASISTHNGRPSQIMITGTPLTKKICDLILTKQESNNYSFTKREITICVEENWIQLNSMPVDIVYVYDNQLNLVEKSSTYTNDCRVNGKFKVNEQYLVFYKVESEGDVYNFEIPHYPYFSIELFAKGNTNKITNDVYMNFDAVSLASVPNFNVNYGGILNTPLVFNIIYQNQEEPIVVFE